jgi:hypothetical protein
VRLLSSTSGKNMLSCMCDFANVKWKRQFAGSDNFGFNSAGLQHVLSHSMHLENSIYIENQRDPKDAAVISQISAKVTPWRRRRG